MEKDKKKDKEVYLYFNECDNIKYPAYNDDDDYYLLLRDYYDVISNANLKGAL